MHEFFSALLFIARARLIVVPGFLRRIIFNSMRGLRWVVCRVVLEKKISFEKIFIPLLLRIMKNEILCPVSYCRNYQLALCVKCRPSYLNNADSMVLFLSHIRVHISKCFSLSLCTEHATSNGIPQFSASFIIQCLS